MGILPILSFLSYPSYPILPILSFLSYPTIYRFAIQYPLGTSPLYPYCFRHLPVQGGVKEFDYLDLELRFFPPMLYQPVLPYMGVSYSISGVPLVVPPSLRHRPRCFSYISHCWSPPGIYTLF